MSMFIQIVTAVFLYTHIAAGLAALILFWVPIFTRKGGINHRRVGRWYVNAMWVVVTSAILLCIKNLFIANYLQVIFLGFLALITVRPLWSGISILKSKPALDSRHQLIDRSLLVLIVLAGVVLVCLGFVLSGQAMSNIIFVFGVLGLSNVFELIRSFKKNDQVAWLRAHIYCLCVTGIASHTAFLVFGAASFIAQIFASHWAMLPWFLPTIIGVIGIAIANRRFTAV